jgi:iron complex transport system substrate-binding protein
LWNPDVIIVPPYGGATVEAITESEEWQILDAVKEGRVYQMPKVVVPWDTPAPDSILGIVWLTEKLHPDLVIVNCAEEADYFYRTFYAYEITDDEIITVCKID